VADKGICTVADCGKPAQRIGFCWSHYFRNHRHGSPLAGRTSRGARAKFLYEVVLRHEGDDCLKWPYCSGWGGGSLKLNGKSADVSRHVCELAHGPAPTPRHQAAHTCGNGVGACVNPRHLVWKTPKENCADKLAHGTMNHGERCGTSKLTEAQVREIRSLKGTKNNRELSDMFGVSRGQIRDIQLRKRWKHLD
jgi:hypothetical protein